MTSPPAQRRTHLAHGGHVLPSAPMKRYETLAHTIADEIRNGNLAVGTRLPSLRQIIAQHGVSQSTVFRAYYLLEQWG